MIKNIARIPGKYINTAPYPEQIRAAGAVHDACSDPGSANLHTTRSSAELYAAAFEQGVREEAAAERAAVLQRIKHEEALAQATLNLLASVRVLKLGSTPLSSSLLAKFRKELQPLADTYGTKIVLIGDKSSATLVG